MINSVFRVFAFLFTISVFVANSLPAQAESASTVVERFQESLLQVMQSASESSVQQRYDKLAHSVSNTFHVPLMTQIATGRHWSTAQPSEKAAVVAAFQRMSIATLATLLTDITEKFLKPSESASVPVRPPLSLLTL